MKIITFLLFALGLTLAVFIYAPREVFLPNDCFPQDGPCTVYFEDKSITLTVDQKEINPVLAVSYDVNLKGIKGESSELLLVGESMHMDRDLISLSKMNDHSFKAKRTFPKCEEKEMVWKGVLSVVADNKIFKTVFNFRVSRKGNSHE